MNNLRQIRRRADVTQLQLAKIVDTTSVTISNIEAGYDCFLSTAKKIAKYFKVPIEKIWPKNGKFLSHSKK